MARAQIPKRLVTVADVARAAGVSKATAARVLGGYGTVSDALRTAVEAAAARLDYRPNELARTMSTGRSATVGVVVGDIENPFFGSVVRGISDRAKDRGYGVVLANSGENPAEERAAVAMLTAKRVDGLIVAPAARSDGAHLADAVARRVPLVLIDREVEGLTADAAVGNDYAAARQVTRLLLAAGHRRIAYVTANRSPTPFFSDLAQITIATVLGRLTGFLHEVRAAGIAEPERFVRLGAVSTPAAQALLAELLGGSPAPTAVLASDSLIALEVFRAARALGIAIPRQLSLATFDDADWTSALSPTVTVLAQPAYALGSEAMTMLFERIDGRTRVKRLVLDAALIERESIAPPPD